jgi:hypothetical protein
MQVELDPSQANFAFNVLTICMGALLVLGLFAVFVYQYFQLKLGPHWQLFWITLLLITPIIAGVLITRMPNGSWRLIVALALIGSLYGAYQGIFYLRQRLLMDALRQQALSGLDLGQFWSASYYADSYSSNAFWMFEKSEATFTLPNGWSSKADLPAERSEHAPSSITYTRPLRSGDLHFLATLSFDQYVSLDIRSVPRADASATEGQSH